MSKSLMSAKHTRVQKICTLWTHEENFSKDDVVFNGEKFPELSIISGSLIQILILKQATAVRDFQAAAADAPKENSHAKVNDTEKESVSEAHHKRNRKGSVRVTVDESGPQIYDGRSADANKSYIFVARPMPMELKSKHPNLQVFVAKCI
jgi:hypothetical protein